MLERLLRNVRPEPPSAPPGQSAASPAASDLPRTAMDAFVAPLLSTSLTILRRIHELGSPEGRTALAAVGDVLGPSALERMVLLGQQPASAPSSSQAQKTSEAGGGSVAGATANALRNWIRGVREGVFQVRARRYTGAEYI